MGLKALRRIMVVGLVGLGLFVTLVAWAVELTFTPIDKECKCYRVQFKLPEPEKGNVYLKVDINNVRVRGLNADEDFFWTSPAAKVEQDGQGNWIAIFFICFIDKKGKKGVSVSVTYTSFQGRPGTTPRTTGVLGQVDGRVDLRKCESPPERKPPDGKPPLDKKPPNSKFSCCKKNIELQGILFPAPQQASETIPVRNPGIARRSGVFVATWQRQGQQHIYVEFKMLIKWDCEKNPDKGWCLGTVNPSKLHEEPRQFNPATHAWDKIPETRSSMISWQTEECDGGGKLGVITVWYKATYGGTNNITGTLTLGFMDKTGKKEWIFSIEITQVAGNSIKLERDAVFGRAR